MADKDEKRPSFSAFVKKSKDKISSRLKGKITKEDEESSTSSPPDEKTKAQMRRAQVRRAQIQHRQRKAEYVKQLEMDVNAYRSMIARAESETGVIRRENELLKRELAQSLPAPPIPAPMEGVEMFGGVDVGDLTVTIGIDNTLGEPCFHITSSSSGESITTGTISPPLQEESASSPGRRGEALSPEQERAAINFILALEHVCWDHFALGDFPGHTHHKEEGMGHALMATTFCMSGAPESFYKARDAFGTTMADADMMKMGLPDDDVVPPPEKEKHESTAEKTHAAVEKGKSPGVMQWQTSEHISLSALKGLASSLNPGDIELTPVQAWFELASRYPPEILLRSDILTTLKIELKGVVRCVYFGAVMERQAFESVVQRVFTQFEF